VPHVPVLHVEILLLSANGYGIGAQKLVRGMYERAVTARYLSPPDTCTNIPKKLMIFWPINEWMIES
jgi:hypothetical protein